MSRQLDDLPCPFCGLLCDDLRASVEAMQVRMDTRGCARAAELYPRVLCAPVGCRIAQVPASPAAAIARAAELLRAAARPLLLSGATEVATQRALLALADRCNGVVDHQAEGAARNLRVLQDGGWITTTLAEIRNRADVLLCVGTDVSSRFPRFFERCARAGGLLGEGRAAPRLIFLGAQAPVGVEAWQVPVAPGMLPDAIAQLRALSAGRAPTHADPALAELAQVMRSARYGVVVWAAAAFEQAHAELTIGTLCEWIKDLNRDTRIAGLPLAGTHGDLTAMQVTLWQSGLPLRTRFGAAGPEHDAHRFAWRQWLRPGAADAMLYVNEIDPELAPPECSVPRIVLGPHGMAAPACEVFIPVGTPGVDRGGHLYRTDNVVALRLKPVVERDVLHAPDVLAQLLAALEALPA